MSAVDRAVFATKPAKQTGAGRPVRRSGWAAALAGLAALSVAACQPEASQESAPAKPRTVWADRVLAATGDGTVRLSGTIEPRFDTPLGFRVAGKIASRSVDVGASAAEGDVIATLDDTDFRHALASAQAQERAAEAAAKRASADLERAQSLKDRGHTSQAALDAAEAEERSAVEALKAAQERRQIAENELAYTTLRADADGVVTAVTAERGQVVEVGQAVVNLARAGTREAEVAIPEAYVARLGDAPATVTLWARPDAEITALLRELSPEADAASRSYTARFTLEDPDGLAKLGMSATVELALGEQDDSLDVPLSAVFFRGDDAFVWRGRAGHGQLEAVPVTLRRYGETRARVTGPLEPGDLVVSMGVHRLDETQTVFLEERSGERKVAEGPLQ